MTPDLLQRATGCTADRATIFAPHIAEAFVAYSINTPARQAAFLAQIGHESGSFRYLREIWGPTPAQRRYEGRTDLGNLIEGDGQRFCGRGLIQVTGRFNHRAAMIALRKVFGPAVPDFELEPQKLEEPRWATLSAADYWHRHQCDALADSGHFETLTQAINGGLNGLADRITRWDRAKAAFGVAPTRAPATAPAPQPVKPTPTPEPVMLPALITALLPSLIDSVPKLLSIFKPDDPSPMADRNIKAATVAFEVAKSALGAANEQEVVERLASDPAAAATVQAAIADNWFALTEAGGGGIAGARKADAAAQAGGAPLWHSPSFVVTLLLVPLVYMIVASLVGVLGNVEWSDEVRASLATGIVTLIIGGAAGYYWGATTTRNRTPAP